MNGTLVYSSIRMLPNLTSPTYGLSDLSTRTQRDRVGDRTRALFVSKRARIRFFLPLFTASEPDSPDSGGTYPVAANTVRRAIHRLASANRVIT